MKNKKYTYINEIIRITYKCNWKCKFCNVLKTNNFWNKDIESKEVIYKILSLVKRYSKIQRKHLTVSLSWWEPTLDKNLWNYIKLLKEVWIWNVQIQTNWTNLFKDKELINKYIKYWLDEIFLAQHWNIDEINKKMWIYYNQDDFKNWILYIITNGINKKVKINLNIVVNKINIIYMYDYMSYLNKIRFLEILTLKFWINQKEISFWFVQPNWYAYLNKENILLKYTDEEIKEIDKVVKLCKENKILLDFHFTAPPLCVLNYPEYNLEYEKLEKLEQNKINWDINEANLKSYEFLWKEKTKFEECRECKYNNYCLWFYKNWIDFVWKIYVKEKINKFITNKNV